MPRTSTPARACATVAWKFPLGSLLLFREPRRSEVRATRALPEWAPEVVRYTPESGQIAERIVLSKRSSDARALNREMATQFPNESWIQSTRTGSGVVVAVARPKHHPVVAQGNRPAIAVGGDVANGQNCHGVAGSRMDESCPFIATPPKR